MKNLYFIISLILGIVLFTGCKDSDDTDKIEVDKVLKGSSEHWQATYDVEGYLEFTKNNEGLEVNSDGNYKLIVTYKGALEDIQDMRNMSMEAPWGGSSATTSDAPLKKEFKYQGSVDGGIISNINKDEEVKITITWDGMNGGSEEIVLNQEVNVETNTNKAGSNEKYEAHTEGDEMANYQLKMDFLPNEQSETIQINGYGNYESSLQLFDADSNVLFETKKGELFGNVKEIETLDFNGDNLQDIVVITDAGGSTGAHEYYLYSYSDGAFSGAKFDEFNASNEFDVEFKTNSVSLIFKESGAEEVIAFNDETKSTLKSLEINSPSHYDWYPRILYHYYDNNSELIMVARNQLMVEHKLLVVAEVLVEYGFRNGNWVPIGWDVKDKQIN